MVLLRSRQAAQMLSCFLLIIICVTIFSTIAAHRTPLSNTQRPILASQPNLYIDDMDGDGFEDWILTAEHATLYITSSDPLSIGKSYTRVPFTSNTTLIATIITGNFFGSSQPKVLCAIGNTSVAAGSSIFPSMRSQTPIVCGILHQERYEVEWIVKQQMLPFRIIDRKKSTGGSGTGSSSVLDTSSAVDVIVGDYDGDGKDELLLYSPSTGIFTSYSLRSTTSSLLDGPFEFSTQYANLQLTDNIDSPSYSISTIDQQVYQAKMMDECRICVMSMYTMKRCNKNASASSSSLTPPTEQLWSLPIIPASPPNLTSAPYRHYELDMSTDTGTYAPTGLVLVDLARGVVQVFVSCLSSRGVPVLTRVSVTSAQFIRSSTANPELISFANIRGVREIDEMAIVNQQRNQLRFYALKETGISTYSLVRFTQPLGDIGKVMNEIMIATNASTAASSSSTPVKTEIMWLRQKKPLIIQAGSEKGVSLVPSRTNASSSSSAVLSSQQLISSRRSDLVLFNSRTNLMYTFIATCVSSIPKDRIGGGSSDSGATAALDADDPILRQALDALFANTKSTPVSLPYHTTHTYLFLSSNAPLLLDSDPDGDSILTRYELGGYDPEWTGVSKEPLHTYGCSPYKKDVLVEVDFMQDHEKTLKPFDNFDLPAKENFAEHQIVLHTFVDQPIPRVKNLGVKANGSGSYQWQDDFDPLKRQYFTPTRRGFFHYCIFIDTFNSGSVSGQSRSVNSNDFIISLGAWSGGRGTLQQQQGTFLHELGHNLNLMHGGGDEVNWKPNHLSVMNYAFQVGGVKVDGVQKITLSTVSCLDLNESSLLESNGLSCRLSHQARGHQYATLVDGKWFDINKQADWNQDGRIEEEAIPFDLNGESLSLLHGSPDEFTRMRFDGLDRIPKDYSVYGVDGTDVEYGDVDETGSVERRRLLNVPQEEQHQPELSFEEFTHFSNANPDDSATSSSNHTSLPSITDVIVIPQSVMHWIYKITTWLKGDG